MAPGWERVHAAAAERQRRRDRVIEYIKVIFGFAIIAFVFGFMYWHDTDRRKRIENCKAECEGRDLGRDNCEWLCNK